jgi:hypothetical protein
MPAQVDYTSRDYNAIRYDLIQVVKNRIPTWVEDQYSTSDFTLALVEAFSYLGDLVSYYVDRAVNEATIATATQLSTLLNFAELAGYKPSGPTPGFTSLTFKNTSAYPLDLPVGTQATAILKGGDFTQAWYETTQAISNLAPGASATVIAIEGKTSSGGLDSNNNVLPKSLGTASGLAYQTFVIPDQGVVDGSIDVYVGQASSFSKWTYIWNLVEAGPDDQVFSTKFNSDGTTSILFGDGVNGAVPGASNSVSVTYRYSIGAAGNIDANQVSTLSYIPGIGLNPPSTIATVTNGTAVYGGNDGANLALIRKNIGKALASRGRATSLVDYENLAFMVPGVGAVNATAAVYSSVILYVQPLNDYTTTPGLVSGVTTANWNSLANSVGLFLSDRIPANSTVTVLPPSYVDIDLTVSVTTGSAYKQRDIQIAVAKALIDINEGIFTYNQYSFGDTVSLSSVISTIMGVDGILQVDVSKLCKHGGSGAANVTMGPGEIPILQSSNLTITVIGGIA